MKFTSRAGEMSRRAVTGVTRTALLALIVGSGEAIAQARPPANVQTATAEFQERLRQYIDLRIELSKKLKPLTLTPSPTELSERQTALAAAIRSARATAVPGDVIPPSAAAAIRAAVLEDLMRRTASDERAVRSETPGTGRPVVNRTYPSDWARATVPPLLLMNLPRLPDNLQYRFYGRYLILLDTDVQVILDYVPNVLPPQ